MDYSSDPANNVSPNQHDYEQLVSIYNNVDSSLAQPRSSNMATDHEMDITDSESWGIPLKYSNGRPATFQLDLDDQNKIITHVIW